MGQFKQLTASPNGIPRDEQNAARNAGIFPLRAARHDHPIPTQKTGSHSRALVPTCTAGGPTRTLVFLKRSRSLPLRSLPFVHDPRRSHRSTRRAVEPRVGSRRFRAVSRPKKKSDVTTQRFAQPRRERGTTDETERTVRPEDVALSRKIWCSHALFHCYRARSSRPPLVRRVLFGARGSSARWRVDLRRRRLGDTGPTTFEAGRP